MRKGIICFISLFLLLAFCRLSDARYDFFGGFIPEGTPTIDGVISSGEWKESGKTTLYKFFGEDSKIEIYMMWDSTYLYLNAKIEDFELWVDSYDPVKPWESTWDDDAFKWEIDPDFSRDEYMQSNDRVFAINANGSATRFDKGDGAGGTLGVSPVYSIVSAAIADGILNDYTFKTLVSESQKDKGFVVEIAISWKDIFGSSASVAPGDGYSLGMNFTNIEDDTGGPLDAGYYNEWKRVYDEITRFMGEEGHPENWAEFVLSSKNDRTPPAAVSSLTISNTNAFSTGISFTATGDNGSSGYAKAYDIRYSQSAITSASWSSTTEYRNNFRPQKAGKKESFKIIGLSPNTKYYIGVRAVDEQGNASEIATASFTTTAAGGPDDKGFLAVDPGQRYFAWEKGDPMVVIGDNQGIGWPGIRCFYNGPMWSDSLWQNINWYDQEGMQDGRDYLKYLSDHGVNTIRIFAEDMQPYNPVYLFTDVSAGPSNIVFNQNTLDFLETLLDECAKVNINVILSPFDTFHYSEVFRNPLVPSVWAKVPFSTAKGGPMATQEDFFEASNIEYIKAVIKKLVDTLGDRKNLLAWEIVNEFDSDEPWIGWNRATAEKREQTVNALEEYIRTIDPDHMVFISSVRWDPKFNDHRITTPNTIVMGPDPALVLNNNHFNFSSTHMYYHDIRDPSLNNPDHRTAPDGSFTYKIEATDNDKTIAPSVRMKQGVQFYYANSLTPKPYACTEYGPIQFFTTKYDEYFTEEQDNQMFHNAMWTYLATGEVGTGLRWPGEMMADHRLTDQMRDYQLAFKHFIDGGNLDFSGFQPVPIGQYLQISNTTLPVIKTGITDGKQGVIFLTNDERKQTNGTISGARLTVPKLTPYSKYTFEFWDSYDETKTACTSSVSATSNGSGNAVINLPDIVRTQVIKFFYTGSSGVDGGYPVTSELWAKAILQVPGNPVTLVWQEVGRDITPSGDQVISGYFYADPNDFAYGSRYNPEVFVKIYTATNGWCNIAFNHVTVDDVTVYSAHNYSGTPDKTGTVTLSGRLAEHQYNGVAIDTGMGSYPDDRPLSLLAATLAGGGYIINSGLWEKAVLQAPGGAVTLKWKEVGSDTTLTGARVVSGYFYADPADFAYGSEYNPELFVKIYIDPNGWANIASNHVTVDNVGVYSSHNYDGTADQSGTATLGNRLVEHQYTGVTIE